MLTLDTTDMETAVGGTFWTELTATGGKIADKIAITDDFQYSTTTNINERAAVGRLWYFVDQKVESQQTDAAHTTTCTLPKVYVSDGSADGRRQVAKAMGMGYPGANAGPVGQWEQIAGGPALGTAFNVYRRAFHTETPVWDKTKAPCDVRGAYGGGWVPPGAINATVEYTTTVVREARYPATGEAGYANTYFNLELTKELTSDNWTRDDQDAHYEDLATRLWHEYQNPHFTGGVSFIGSKEWGWSLDLCHRLAFSTSMGVVGGGDLLRKFWGLVNSVTVDLESDRVDAQFDNRSPLADLAMQVVEDFGVDAQARLREAQARMRAMTTLPECLSGMGHIVNVSAPMSVCGRSVTQETRNITVNIGIRKGKEQIMGMGETAMAVADPVTGPAVSAYTTHGTRASSTVERDLNGSLWYMSPQGVFPATAAGGGLATVNTGSSSHYPHAIPQENGNAVANAMAAMTGLTPVTSTPPAYTYVSSSSNGATTTTFTIGHTGLSSAVGGQILINDFDPATPRAAYTITAHSGGDVEVSLLSDALPSDGSSAVVYYPAAPTLDATDFPSGGVALQDSNDDYVVYDTATATLFAASLTDNELAKQAGTGNSRVVRFGPTKGSNMDADWGSNSDSGIVSDLDLNDLKDLAGETEGTLLYYDGTTGSWKVTGVDVIFDDTTSTLQLSSDATSGTQPPRLSQLTSTASGKGASQVGIEDAGGYTSNEDVEAALQEVYGKLKTVAWDLWVPLHGTQVQDMGSGTLSNAGVGIVSSSDYDGHSVAANWGASSQEGFAFSLCVPSDLDTGSVVTAKLYYRLSGNPGSRHAAYCGIDARAVADNEVTISGGSLANVATVKELDDGGYNSGDLVVHSVGTLFAASTLAGGDYVKGVAYRDPTNADDDYTGTCQFIGVLFSGTRSL